jgi:hypothetical protein
MPPRGRSLPLPHSSAQLPAVTEAAGAARDRRSSSPRQIMRGSCAANWRESIQLQSHLWSGFVPEPSLRRMCRDDSSLRDCGLAVGRRDRSVTVPAEDREHLGLKPRFPPNIGDARHLRPVLSRAAPIDSCPTSQRRRSQGSTAPVQNWS